MNSSDPIAETIATYDLIAAAYAKKWASFANLEPLKKAADQFIGLLSGIEILDVGCGHGRDAAYFQKHGLHVTGIDLSTELLKLAKEHAPGVKFLKMDMRNIEFEAEQFDGIWACSSFMHLPKRYALKTLKEFNRVLKPQGLTYLSAIEGETEGLVAQEGIHGGRRKYFASYTEAELVSLFEVAGFTILEVFKTNTNNPWLNLFSRKGQA